MAKTLQFRRYTTSNLASVTGASGELIVDTSQNILTIHDGVTTGGWPTPTLSYTQAAFAYANSIQSSIANSINYGTGVDLSQNNSIATTAQQVVYLQGALNSANANIVSVQALANVVGFTTGNGGLSTQITSRTTPITLNKPSGQITLFSQAMTAFTANTFIFTNSAIGANDFIMFNHWSGGTIGNYIINSNTGVGTANVTIRSLNTVTAESPVLQYIVIKGTTS